MSASVLMDSLEMGVLVWVSLNYLLSFGIHLPKVEACEPIKQL